MFLKMRFFRRLYSKYNFSEIIVSTTFLIVITYIFSYLALGSSPRYVISPSVDANAFFTVGKAMANGATIYKDIFEQKGPLLYLIHAVAYKLSNTSFAGVFIFELLAIFMIAFYATKIISVYFKRNFEYAIVPVFLVSILCSNCFEYGDFPEEYTLALFMFSLYHFVKYFKKNRDIKIYVFFISGIFAGCCAMMKYTLLGIYFGWMAVLAIHKFFITKERKKAILNCIVFLFGMAISIIPWIIYFYKKDALNDFIYAYFTLNATAYGKTNTGLFNHIYAMCASYAHNVIKSPVFAITTLAGAVIFASVKQFTDGKLFSRLSVPVLLVCTAFFTYIGGISYKYYILILADFSIFFYILIGMLLKKLLRKDWLKRVMILLVVASLTGSMTFILCVNTTCRNNVTIDNKEDSPIYQITTFIKSKNPYASVLCYNGLDNGIYTLGNFTPEFKYFELQNIPYENFAENKDEQDRYVNEAIPDYVCVAHYNNSNVQYKESDVYNDNENLQTKYKLVRQYFYRPYNVNYFLFEKVGD